MTSNNRLNIFLKFFGSLMILLYLGMGFLFIFSSLFEERFSKLTRYSLGVLFIGYGIFRLYRILKPNKYANDQE